MPELDGNFISTLATSLMVENVSAIAGTDYIDIVWMAPRLRPMLYKTLVMCWMVSNGVIYKYKTYKANSEDTTIRVNDLYQGSRCAYTLFAVYNPASKDDGITNKVLTLIASKQNLYPGCMVLYM